MMREQTAKPFPWRCPKCLKRAVQPNVLPEYQAKAKHDGRLHEFTIPALQVARCQACGEVLFTNETDEQISRALRENLGLLQPEQIRALRAERTQQDFADLLGTATETISRWETGVVIQSRSMDKFLRIFMTLPEAEETLRQPRGASVPNEWAKAVSPNALPAFQAPFSWDAMFEVSYETPPPAPVETPYGLAA